MENPFTEISDRLDRIECILEKIQEKEIPALNDNRLTREEVSHIYKISLPTVHKMMKQGLPYQKIGRKTIFRKEDIEKFIS